ncbi:MAG: calcium/sodium antiporter, partial [Balneolales bacterium]
MVILQFMAGLVLLMLGAEALVRGASRIAAALRIAPLVIGLTVVAYGTGAPEIAVSVKAVISGQADISVGNIIGSNIINILLILGLAAVIMPMTVSHKLIQLDVPLLIITSVVVLFMGLDGIFSQADGLILFAVLIVYTVFLIFNSRLKEGNDLSEYAGESSPSGKKTAITWVLDIGLIVGGIFILVTGADWLVDGAVLFAVYLGISELVIGLTIVSVGTSLPELVTSVVASLRGERNMAIGNIVGSCLFNLLGVLGLASIFAPGGLSVADAVIRFDIPVMIATAVACLPIFFTGGVISRWEAAVFLGYYGAYTLYLILAEAHHEALPGFSGTMLYFVLPLTTVTLFILTLQEYRKRKAW